MKEVKAYIRHQTVNRVVENLEREGFSEMTLIDVRGITAALPQAEYKYSLELAEKYMDVIKLEIVCSDDQASRIVEIIRQTAHTGRGGDGIVFVTPVDQVLKV